MATFTLYSYRFTYENPHSGVDWFDHQGDHPQTANALGWKGGLRTVESVLAHHVNVHEALRNAATAMYLRASTNMAMHRDTGAARVYKTKGDLDWYISLEDRDMASKKPAKGMKGRRSDGSTNRAYSRKRSALSIEFGHQIRGSDKRVGGLFILTNAANSMARNSGKKW